MPDARMVRLFAPASLLTGCVVPPVAETAGSASGTEARSPVASALAARGRSFAEAQCSGCHALSAGESPNPQAPSFAAVANEMNFTPASLREFFVDGHDLPGMMTIRLDDEDADAMTAYILSLQKPG